MHSIFGPKHLIILAISVVALIAVYLVMRRMTLVSVCRMVLYCGIVSEIIKIFYYIIRNEETHGGVLPKSDLPFHLCSIQILLIVIVTTVNSEKIKRMVLSFMMPSCMCGGVAAMLIATSSSLNGMLILTFQYFGYHALISAFGIYLLTSKEFGVTYKDYFSCLKFLLIVMFFAFYINSIVYDGVSNVNYMYVVSPPQSGLPFLNEEHGWLVYIVHYAFLVITCLTLCYIKPIIKALRSRISKKSVVSDTEEKIPETV